MPSLLLRLLRLLHIFLVSCILFDTVDQFFFFFFFFFSLFIVGFLLVGFGFSLMHAANENKNKSEETADTWTHNYILMWNLAPSPMSYYFRSLHTPCLFVLFSLFSFSFSLFVLVYFVVSCFCCTYAMRHSIASNVWKWRTRDRDSRPSNDEDDDVVTHSHT